MCSFQEVSARIEKKLDSPFIKEVITLRKGRYEKNKNAKYCNNFFLIWDETKIYMQRKSLVRS